MSRLQEHVLEVPRLPADRWAERGMQSLLDPSATRLFYAGRSEFAEFARSHFGGQPSLGRQTLADSARETVLAEARAISFRFERRIQELWHLPPDWDGEGALAVRQDVLAKAVNIVRRLKAKTAARFVEPFVSPTYDGFVQLDWTSELRLFEAQFVAGGVHLLGTEISLRGEREYFTAEGCDVAEAIWQGYRWFCGSEPVWPSSL
jgi:hypothetical protein